MTAGDAKAGVNVYPVLDLLDGHVVRGIGGRRAEYRPLVSRLTASTSPIDVARAIRDHFDLTHFYVADLDAIAGRPPATATYAALQALGFILAVDAGLRTANDALPLLRCGVSGLVAGLETLPGLDPLSELLHLAGAERLIFSLDLRAGQPITQAGWNGPRDAWHIAAEAVRLGVRRLLVLDLARVGGGSGTGTEALCERLATAFPPVEVLAGGGVRGRSDLEQIGRCGVRGVLVASALHDGTW